MGDPHLRVRAGGEDYALALDDVLEVAELGEITAVPGARREILGVRNLRGRVVAVVDLAGVLGLPDDGEREWIVIVGDAGRRAGLAVSAVGDIGPIPQATQAAESVYLTSAALVGGARVGVIDLPAVFAALVPEGTAA